MNNTKDVLLHTKEPVQLGANTNSTVPDMEWLYSAIIIL